ncbi:MAG: RHS repeat-associated core domain-containing protein [Pirellula sp.]
MRDSYLSHDSNGLYKTNRILEDEQGRGWTYTSYDYDTPLGYSKPNKSDTNASDTDFDNTNDHTLDNTTDTNLYDPTDFRGNPIRIVSVTGVTSILYETDNEAGYFKGLPYLITDVSGAKTEFSYDTKGRIRRKQQIRGAEDPATGTTTTLPDAIERWSYYPSSSPLGANGDQLQTYTNALGLVTEYEYNDERRLSRVDITDAYLDNGTQDNAVQTYTYDAFGFLSAVTTADKVGNNPGQTVSVARTIYDAVGFLRQSSTENANGTIESMTQFDYDSDGSVNAKRRFIDANTTIVDRFAYDSRGLVISERRADGAQFLDSYTGAVRSITQETKYEYYKDGTLRKVIHPQKLIGNATTTEVATHYFAAPASRESWAVQTQVAAVPTIASILATPNLAFTNSVDYAKSDSWGRAIETQNLLSGALSKYHYDDYRFDDPTRTLESVTFGTPNAGAWEGTWIKGERGTRVDFDQRGLVIRSKPIQSATAKNETNQVPPVFHEYDELGFTKSIRFPSLSGGTWTYITDPVGNVIESKEERAAESQAKQTFTNRYKFDQRGRVREADMAVTADTVTPVQRQITRTTYVIADTTVDQDPMMGATPRSVQTTNTEGLITTTAVDSAGRTIVTVNPLGGAARHVFDTAGRMISEQFTPANGDTLPARVTNHEYDQLDRLRRTDRMDNSSIFSSDFVDYYDDQYWSMITYSNVPGNATTAERQIRGAKSKVDSLGQPILVQQPFAGTLAEFNALAATARNTGITLFSYNYLPNDRLTATTSRLSQASFTGGIAVVPSIQRDHVNARVQRVVTNTNGNTVLSMDRLSGFDGTDGIVNATTYLDTGFRVLGRALYDESGAATRQFDTLGKMTETVYDYASSGTAQPKQIISPAGDRTVFSYDTAGNLLSQQNVKAAGANNDTSPPVVWTYDGLGRKTSEKTRVSTTSASSSVEVERKWSYPSSLVTEYTNRNGIRQTTTLDPTARTSTTSTTGAANAAINTAITQLYSDGSVSSTNDQWSNNNAVPTARRDFQSTLNFTYDTLGFQTNETATASRSGLILANPAFARTRPTADSTQSTLAIDFEQLTTITHQRDNLGRIKSIGQQTPNTFLGMFPDENPGAKSVTYTRNVDSALATMFIDERVIRTGPEVGVSRSTFAYHSDGRMKSVDHLRPGGLAIAVYESEYDSRGFLQSSVRKLPPTERSKGNDEFQRFNYDEEGRLLSVTYGVGNDPLTKNTHTIPIDPKDGGGNSSSDKIGSGERLISDLLHTYEYDEEGNVVKKTSAENNRWIVDEGVGKSVGGSVSFPATSRSGWPRQPGNVNGSQLLLTGTALSIIGGGMKDTVVLFKDVAPGDYDVITTWKPVTGTIPGIEGTYSIQPATGTRVSTATINFANAPDANAPGAFTDAASVTWQLLATVTVEQLDSVMVKFNKADRFQEGAIVFDAIRLIPKVFRENYTWDHRNQLVDVKQYAFGNAQVSTIEYQYDGASRHVLTTRTDINRQNSTTTSTALQHVYDGSQRVMDLDVYESTAPTVNQTYFYGEDGNILGVNSTLIPRNQNAFTEKTSWYFSDLNGVPQVVAGFSKDRPTHFSAKIQYFDAYGNVQRTEGEYRFLAPIVWKGAIQDQTLDLYEFGNRLYDPTSNRFNTEDLRVGQTNPYLFSGGNPLASGAMSDGLRMGLRAGEAAAREQIDRPREFSYEELPQIYGRNWLTGTWNYAIGENVRWATGDKWLSQANDAELLGLSTVMAGGIVLGGWAGGTIAGAAELTGTSYFALSGAVAGSVEYVALAGAANAMDLADGGGHSANGLSASKLGTSIAFGALGGGAGNIIGRGVGRYIASPAISYVSKTARPYVLGTSIYVNANVRPGIAKFLSSAPWGTGSLYVHLTEAQYEAVKASGYLGKGYQGLSEILLPPIPFIRKTGFDEGRIWATAYSREQLSGVNGVFRLLSDGINPITFRARTKTIELTGEAANEFARPYGRTFSHNVFGWLKGVSGTQQQFRGRLKYVGNDVISSLDGSVLYTGHQMRSFRMGEWQRMALYGGTAGGLVWWGLRNE